MTGSHKRMVLSQRMKNEAFEEWLSEYWPLWRDPRNQGNIRYHDLRAAFDAGWTNRPVRLKQIIDRVLAKKVETA